MCLVSCGRLSTAGVLRDGDAAVVSRLGRRCDRAARLARSFLHPARGDARNFHAWKYRLWLVQRIGRSAEEELAFTQRLLEVDRRNFSAWHYRSVLLPRVHAARGHRTLEELLAEPGTVSDGGKEVAPTSSVPLYELQAELDLLQKVRCDAPADPRGAFAAPDHSS